MAKSDPRVVDSPSGVVVKSNRIPVKVATLHQVVMIPGLFTSERHLDTTKRPITLELGPEGLWIIPNDKSLGTGIVPHANIAIVVLKT